jgi:hypothetical protein
MLCCCPDALQSSSSLLGRNSENIKNMIEYQFDYLDVWTWLGLGQCL